MVLPRTLLSVELRLPRLLVFLRSWLCKCWLACTAVLFFLVSRVLLVRVCRFDRATAVPCILYLFDCASPRREAVSVLTRHSPARRLVPTCYLLAAVHAALLVLAFAAPMSALICACTPMVWFLLLLLGICCAARADSRSGLSLLRLSETTAVAAFFFLSPRRLPRLCFRHFAVYYTAFASRQLILTMKRGRRHRSGYGCIAKSHGPLSAIATGGGGFSTANTGMVFSCFNTASKTWATVSSTIASYPRFISSETLKPPTAINNFGLSLVLQRSAACLAFAFTPAVTVACRNASFVADAMLRVLPPTS